MSLRSDEPWMKVGRQLDCLDEGSASGLMAPREDHAMLFHQALVPVVELVPVAVALADTLLTVRAMHERSRLQLAVVGSQAHRAAHHRDVPLLRHKIDHGVRCRFIDLGRICIAESADVARKLDACELHPKTDSQEW